MDNKPATREEEATAVNPSPPPQVTTATVSFKPPPSPATPSATAQQPPPPDPTPRDAYLFPVPSYSRWFSWTSIHECEVRLLPEFFASKSLSKTPRVYVYYRNSIIRLHLRNPAQKVTFTDARKTVVGDVGSIRRVFDFLEAWGLINYGGSGNSKALKWDDKETGKSEGRGDGNAMAEVASGKNDGRKRICGGCKSVCTIACFACDKYHLTLCARCYVRGNYRVGVSSTDFRRVEISEDMKADWTDKETLHLLEAIMHYGDDWRRVAHHVGGRSEKECVARFLKLPFAEEFVDFPDSGEIDAESNSVKDQHDNESVSPSYKKLRLTPLADASNPIMAQAAFLSALAGVRVAEAAAQAALTNLSEVEYGIGRGRDRDRGIVVSNSKGTGSIDGKLSGEGEATLNESEAALMEANSMLEKEELDIEKVVSEIVEVQLKDIHNKIVRFEELEFLMEKERRQFDEMKHMLFVDQLALLSHRKSAPKMGDSLKDP